MKKPTEIEIAKLLEITRSTVHHATVRGLAYERDRLQADNERLRAALNDVVEFSNNEAKSKRAKWAINKACKALSTETTAAPCIECGETGNHNPLCISGNRFD